MPKFNVISTVSVEADNPQDAAMKAVGAARRDPPTVYEVIGPEGYRFPVQLDDMQLKEAVDRIWYQKD